MILLIIREKRDLMDKSIVLVGNGPSLRGSKLGKKIDEFDEVIRFNNLNIIGFEEDVGKKTTIWITYNPEKKFTKFIRDYTNRGYSKEEIYSMIKDIKEIWYISPLQEHLNRQWKYRPLNSIGMKNVIKRYESLDKRNEIEKIVTHATTGFIAIDIFLSIYDKIYLIGFDFGNVRDKTTQLNHYFSDKETVTNIGPHNLEFEYTYIKNLIDDNRIEYLIDKSSVIRSHIKSHPNIKRICSFCGKESNSYVWEKSSCHYCESDI